MTVYLKEFQIKALAQLMEAVESGKKEIVFKSPTGSGKTIVLTKFMDEYVKSIPNTVFIWLTPGKGNLEIQSKDKMDNYIYGSSTKLINDIMAEGFSENDSCFINWEKVTKKGNKVILESEYGNLIDNIKKAHNQGLNFIVIIDESHQHETSKASFLVEQFKPINIIRTSATPTNNKKALVIDIPERDVIEEGLIKKNLIINENFEDEIQTDNMEFYLIKHALKKHTDIKAEYAKLQIGINPLVIIQLPNNNDFMINSVEEYLFSKGITYESKRLAIWLSKRHENKENIENIDSTIEVILIKQAIATGWDCPRAHILVKLRDTSNETFEIQTIGRIRRMPQARHYENEILDSCYLYTIDEQFKNEVQTALGKDALNVRMVTLKDEFKEISILKEFKEQVTSRRDPTIMLQVLREFFVRKYSLGINVIDNKEVLERKKYLFNTNIERHTVKGKVYILNENEFKPLNKSRFQENLSTHAHGREFHNKVGQLGTKISLPYEHMNIVIRRLFHKQTPYNKKILSLDTPMFYSFVINNFDILLNDIREMLSQIKTEQLQMELPGVTTSKVKFPKYFRMTYDKNNPVQKIYKKNIYSDYLSSVEPRSDSEKTFELYCEDSSQVDWWYKNGDKGQEYVAIVYADGIKTQKSFYPDYVISVNQKIWIIETKGGMSRSGASEDIDKYTERKFEWLKRYLKTNKILGGIVRKDKRSNQLFMCTDVYSDEIKIPNWKLLQEVFDCE